MCSKLGYHGIPSTFPGSLMVIDLKNCQCSSESLSWLLFTHDPFQGNAAALWGKADCVVETVIN